MRLTPAHHHHLEAERVIKQFNEHMRTGCRPDQLDWLPMLPSIEASINNQPSGLMGDRSPFFVENGHHQRLPFENVLAREPDHISKDIFTDIHRSVRLRRLHAQRTRQARSNKNRPAHRFQEGDAVYISTEHWALPAHAAVKMSKFKDKYFGPFPVAEVLDNDYAIRVSLPAHLHQVWPVFHPWHLRPAKKSNFRQQPITFLELNPTYEVEELIATRQVRNKRQYLVQFKGYGPQYMMWLADADIKARRLVNKFWSKRKNIKAEHIENGFVPAETKSSSAVSSPAGQAHNRASDAWPTCTGLNTFTLLTTINNRRLHRRSPTLRKIHDDYSAATASTTTFDFDLRVTSASKRTSGDAIPLQADCGPVNMQHRCLECGAKWNSHNLLHAHLRDNFDQDSEDFKKGPREDWRLSFQKRGCKHSLY